MSQADAHPGARRQSSASLGKADHLDPPSAQAIAHAAPLRLLNVRFGAEHGAAPRRRSTPWPRVLQRRTNCHIVQPFDLMDADECTA